MIYDCIIIGAGASGVFSALNIKSDKILLLDKRSGLEKLSITGRTRCNITNGSNLDEFFESYGKNGRFLQKAFELFFKDQLILFLRSIGIKTVNEKGRIRIANATSDQFSMALRSLLKERKIKFHPFEPATGVIKNSLFEVTTDESTYYSRTLILSCGGISYPKTGSTGDGYKFAAGFGHEITRLSAYESAFCSDYDFSRVEGVSLKDVKLTLRFKKTSKRITGDLIFTHFGVSGPAILKLSEADFDKGILVIELTKMGELEFINFIRDKSCSLARAVSMIVPRRLARFIVTEDTSCKEISKSFLRELSCRLKRFTIDVNKCPIERAFVTKGGVSLKDIDPNTLESKLAQGLFFAGEMLNIQGSIGGFNLQAAFSTGYLTAHSVNKKMLKD